MPLEAQAKKKWYHGIGGIDTNFSVFHTPSWVDTSLPPGHTSQTKMMVNFPQWRSLLSGAYILYSFNLYWLLIAVFVYVVFPYDYEVSKQWDSNYVHWIAKRAVLNVTLCWLWYGYWHFTLYGLGWANRPFNSNRGSYRWSKLIHNAYYTTLGVIQWTGWEAVMLHCYATDRMPYLSNEEAFASPMYGAAHFLLWTITIPLFREIHFYFAHRFIHIKSLYTYVHSVHHRNSDIEPFSGMCMHPIEHLYYFTSVAPSLYFRVTPFAWVWNGIHLIISPAASHSGWEGHSDSDQHHYLHHRYFECNYGTPSFLLDNIFGTFRDKMATKSDTYRGDADGVGEKTAASLDRKATLFAFPNMDQVTFNILFCFATPALFVIRLVNPDTENDDPLFGVASLLVFGPIAGGILLGLINSFFKKRRNSESLGKHLAYPFHKEARHTLGMHIIFGFILGVLPAYHLFHMSLSPQGQGAYFHLWTP